MCTYVHVWGWYQCINKIKVSIPIERGKHKSII